MLTRFPKLNIPAGWVGGWISWQTQPSIAGVWAELGNFISKAAFCLSVSKNIFYKLIGQTINKLELKEGVKNTWGFLGKVPLQLCIFLCLLQKQN